MRRNRETPYRDMESPGLIFPGGAVGGPPTAIPTDGGQAREPRMLPILFSGKGSDLAATIEEKAGQTLTTISCRLKCHWIPAQKKFFYTLYG